MDTSRVLVGGILLPFRAGRKKTDSTMSGFVSEGSLVYMERESEVSKLRRRASLRDRPKSKAGLVRWLWPEISEALARGYQVRELWTAVGESGTRMDYKRFAGYVRELRRSNAALPLRKTAAEPRFGSAVVSTIGESVSGANGSGAEGGIGLPRASTFDYRPARPGDEDKLV